MKNIKLLSLITFAVIFLIQCSKPDFVLPTPGVPDKSFKVPECLEKLELPFKWGNENGKCCGTLNDTIWTSYVGLFREGDSLLSLTFTNYYKSDIVIEQHGFSYLPKKKGIYQMNPYKDGIVQGKARGSHFRIGNGDVTYEEYGLDTTKNIVNTIEILDIDEYSNTYYGVLNVNYAEQYIFDELYPFAKKIKFKDCYFKAKIFK